MQSRLRRPALAALFLSCAGGLACAQPVDADEATTGAEATGAEATTAGGADGSTQDTGGGDSPSTDATTASSTTADASDMSSGGENTSTTEGETSGTTSAGRSTGDEVTSSTAETGACPPDSECRIDDDCAPGQTCIDCLCFGEPTGCGAWNGVGVYAECGGAGPCRGQDDFCLNAGGGASVCSFGCTEVCDCPEPPAGFEDQMRCEDITSNDEDPDCFLSCEGGLACPDGMICAYEAICVHGIAIPPYGDCVDEPGLCEGAVCVGNEFEGYCAPPCEVAADCPDAVGSGTLFCNGNRCQIGCDDDDDVCPPGMSCEGGLCTWTTPYADCGNGVVEGCEDEPTACLNDVCSLVCWGGDGVCPPPPPTGDATVICGYPDPDFDVFPLCYLSCANGETCPDGMFCEDFPGETASCVYG